MPKPPPNSRPQSRYRTIDDFERALLPRARREARRTTTSEPGHDLATRVLRNFRRSLAR